MIIKPIKKKLKKTNIKEREKLDYRVIASGSSGNCVRIENIMVDCGIPYKKLEEELYKVDYLLLTHIHGDHIKKSTYNRIRTEFPNIQVISHRQVAHHFDIDILCQKSIPLQIGSYMITPFWGEHDVEVYGYVWECKGNTIIYATDMINFNYAPDIKYDYLFIEANYDEVKIDLANKQSKSHFNYYNLNGRHASIRTSEAFYYSHRRDRTSEYIQLHKSERFY